MSLRTLRQARLTALKNLLDHATTESALLGLPVASRLIGAAALAVEEEIERLAPQREAATARGEGNVMAAAGTVVAGARGPAPASLTRVPD